VPLIAPPRPPAARPDAGVIEDARRRRRRRHGRLAAVALVALVAAIAALGGSGSGGGAAGAPAATGGLGPRASVGNGISVSLPHGWHLLAPPITSLSYPLDRMLLTSYPARRGGDCAPTRAAAALPPTGALIYLLEYGATAGTPLSRPSGMAFPPQPRTFALRAGDRANYECWTTPTYLLRFRAAGRLFQLQVALGARVAVARRAQVLRILDSLKIQMLTGRSAG
jgi:hypothetical protein